MINGWSTGVPAPGTSNLALSIAPISCKSSIWSFDMPWFGMIWASEESKNRLGFPNQLECKLIWLDIALKLSLAFQGACSSFLFWLAHKTLKTYVPSRLKIIKAYSFCHMGKDINKAAITFMTQTMSIVLGDHQENCCQDTIFQQDLFGVLTHPWWWQSVVHLCAWKLHGRSNQGDGLGEAWKVHLDFHLSRPWQSEGILTRFGEFFYDKWCKVDGPMLRLKNEQWLSKRFSRPLFNRFKDLALGRCDVGQETGHEDPRKPRPSAGSEHSPPSRLPISPATTIFRAGKWSHSESESPPATRVTKKKEKTEQSREDRAFERK